eukprot:jgi/Chlat1/1721/Chrsp13S08690
MVIGMSPWRQLQVSVMRPELEEFQPPVLIRTALETEELLLVIARETKEAARTRRVSRRRRRLDAS